ncbi:hypothetical protein WH47_03360 [Habropoda laboriosa]|uniref:Pre-rRNA-processing protein TSR2 homolog n=1 Tax=Habropoda laboriosa TaxID=597456 RepID=A0A0L7RBA3_9HYME|nr:hypothetical protein WH47_03360 [Habropoda laboriosa]
MAVEHRMGPKERAVDFCPYITEVMYMNEDLTSSEIANELEDYMEEHFITELEDDSAIQVAEDLLKFHRYCTENNANVLATELEKIPPLQPWLLTSEPMHMVQTTCHLESGSSEDEKETPSDMEVIGEWTEVRSRRRR